MALGSMKTLTLTLSLLGALAFLLGVIAENKKPAAGTPVPGGDVVRCLYPSDPTIALGSLSVVFLVASAIIGHISIFYPHNGKAVPRQALLTNAGLVAFIIIAEIFTGLAFALTLWATITESLHRVYNVHHNLQYECPTAKTGLFGGAAFLSLDAVLFWLVCQILTDNTRGDYFASLEDPKGDYGQVYADEVSTAAKV